jgi:hypothetical protein
MHRVSRNIIFLKYNTQLHYGGVGLELSRCERSIVDIIGLFQPSLFILYLLLQDSNIDAQQV